MFDQRLRHRVIPDPAPAVFDGATQRALGQIGNISSAGVLLLTEEEPELHQFLELRVELPREIDGRSSVEFRAEVMWIEPLANTGFLGCGLAFRRITDDQLEILEELIKDYVF
jgi:hypothetical protein